MKINPNDPLIQELKAARANKIFGNNDLLTKYGGEFRTMQGQDLDFQKDTTKWEQDFKREGFTYQKAQDEIEKEFKERQMKISEKDISLKEKDMQFNQSMATKQLNLEAAKFAYSKSRAASGGGSSGGGSNSKSANFDEKYVTEGIKNLSYQIDQKYKDESKMDFSGTFGNVSKAAYEAAKMKTITSIMTDKFNEKSEEGNTIAAAIGEKYGITPDVYNKYK
jgi:hypothetical protein